MSLFLSLNVFDKFIYPRNLLSFCMKCNFQLLKGSENFKDNSVILSVGLTSFPSYMVNRDNIFDFNLHNILLF